MRFSSQSDFRALTVRDLLELSAEEPLDESRLCGVLGDVSDCARRNNIDREVDASLSGGESKRIEIANRYWQEKFEDHGVR